MKAAHRVPRSFCKKMRTLKARLLAGTAAGTALVLVLSSVLLYALMRRSLWAEFDASLGSKARALAAMVEQDRDELELEFNESSFPEFRSSQHAEYYELWLPDGQVFARSSSLGESDLERIEASPDKPTYQTTKLPDGRRGRLVGITFTPRQEDERDHARKPMSVTLVVGRETASIDGTLAQFGLVLVGVCAAALLASVGILAWFVRRGLRPVGDVASQIANVGEADLSARIRPAEIPGELQPIVDRLNGLLARLESAFKREKTFTADVAHELRTPLAGLRSTLEVSLSRQREADAHRKAMTDCLAVSRQMQQMVENLLGLARADANQLEVVREPVELGELLRECWAPLASRAVERGLQIDWKLAEACNLNTDRSKLQLVLHNVLDNAVAYADQGGQISVASHADDGRVAISVTNTGSVLTQEQAERSFDRFWRGDTSRVATGEHCGLGLSLCQKMMMLLGGSISVTSTGKGTFTASIVLMS
ncbi:MAG: sensor histidine kinase N-terminal domain-containing protein [Phycisphaerae bacterium]|nr:sensor histidine kinase N-terminal domain-containing protein [Phycisphaerae bacterium]